jgi:chromosome segregation ATPase
MRHAVRNAACYFEEAPMASSDITIEILKDIRREVRENSKRLDSVDKRLGSMDERLESMDKRLDSINERVEIASQRLDITNERLGVVESTLLTLARRQRITSRHAKAAAEYLVRLDSRVTALESR